MQFVNDVHVLSYALTTKSTSNIKHNAVIFHIFTHFDNPINHFTLLMFYALLERHLHEIHRVSFALFYIHSFNVQMCLAKILIKYLIS